MSSVCLLVILWYLYSCPNFVSFVKCLPACVCIYLCLLVSCVSAQVSLSVLCLFISFGLLAPLLLVLVLLGVLCLLDYLVLTHWWWFLWPISVTHWLWFWIWPFLDFLCMTLFLSLLSCFWILSPHTPITYRNITMLLSGTFYWFIPPRFS